MSFCKESKDPKIQFGVLYPMAFDLADRSDRFEPGTGALVS